MGDYKYVPAGLFFPTHGGVGIYIKYGKYPNKLILKEKSQSHLWFQCPDRELLIVSNHNCAQPFYPSQGTFDEYVDLNVFNDLSSRDLGLDMWMVNYTQFIGKESKAHLTRRGDHVKLPYRSTIISDSGGYQIFAERLDYLAPQNIIEWYNDNVDIGLIIDIPTNIVRKDLYRRLAKIQKFNTEVMLKNKRPDLELMNIFHGSTREDKAIFRDICEVDEIDRLAIGGAYFGSILSSIDTLCETMLTGKKYKHYHVLGVSNVLQTVLLMRLAAKGVAPLISSDSSTPLQEAISKGYHTHLGLTEPPRYIHIGDKINVPDVHKTLPCTCPVCTTIKYTDILGIVSGPIWIPLLYHNIYSVTRYMNTMNGIVKDITTPELQKLLRAQFKGKRDGVEESINSFGYIDALVDGDLTSARKKYGYYLSNLMASVPVSNKTLFSKDNVSRGDVPIIATLETRNTDPAWLRLQRILQTYETDKGIHGKKVNKEDKKRQGHKALRASGVKLPGKKKLTSPRKSNKARKSFLVIS